METISRKVNLLWKYNPTAFELINKDVLGEQYRKIGSSVSAITKILQYPDMLRLLMPQLLGIDPDSNDVNWDRQVKHYWDSLSLDIPSGGKIFETGFNFSLDDFTRQKYIDKLVSEQPIKTDKQLAEYVMGYQGDTPNIPEELRWRYGSPIVVEDYLHWRYMLNYKHVANNPDDVNKSPNIRFYLHTQEDMDRVKKEAFKVKQLALSEYMKFMKTASIDDVNDVLSVLTPDSIKKIVSNEDLEEKQMLIMEIVTSSPNKFINIIKDKNIKLRATIERMLAFTILKQLVGSTVIVETADPSVVIGNNMDEAINFMSNEKNKVKINELISKYKSLTIGENV